jgi:hypothetical protein
MKSLLVLSLTFLFESAKTYGVNYCRDLSEFHDNKFKFKDFLGTWYPLYIS